MLIDVQNSFIVRIVIRPLQSAIAALIVLSYLACEIEVVAPYWLKVAIAQFVLYHHMCTMYKTGI